MVTFSKELKLGTKKSHSAAENTKFVGSFLRGVLNPEEYRNLLAQFYYVYSTMETAIRESNDERVKQVYYPELERVASLEKDLEYYYGPYWKDEIYMTEACNTYTYRIKEIAEQDPYLLVAHHYTRYIGDLSGGQILKNIAKKALNPPVGKGLDFYDFPSIDDAKEWKTIYRFRLDRMGFTESEKNAIISEANYAFRLNMYLFDEIGINDPYPLLTSIKGLFKVLIGGK